MTTELKPCAHCGGRAVHFFENEYPGGQHTNGPRVYYIFCEGCLISTANLTSHSQVKHIAAWNRRHIDREMVDRVVELALDGDGPFIEREDFVTRIVAELEREQIDSLRGESFTR